MLFPDPLVANHGACGGEVLTDFAGEEGAFAVGDGGHGGGGDGVADGGAGVVG